MKWQDGGKPISTHGELNTALSTYGGAWDTRHGRFIDRRTILSLTYRTVNRLLDRSALHFPAT